MALNLRLLGDRVAVEACAGETETPGGILLPESAQVRPQRGTVRAVGNGSRDARGKLIVPDVAVRDEVLYAKYSGTEITLDGITVLILKASDIIAVLGQA